jgi:FkbM family methyltransferase
MSVASVFRPVIDRFFPAISAAYRDLRDAAQLQRQRPAPTPYGVRLMGHPQMVTGTFEAQETAAAQRLLRQIDVFVDVGANVGLYTCLARSAGKTVLAIEPLRRNLDYLYANLRANGFDDVEVFPVGLAGKPGLATLFGMATGASLIQGWAGAPSNLQCTIPLSTLDLVLGERFSGARLLIKIDVEGTELGVLRGAARTLARVPPPVWLVEVTRGEHHPGAVNAEFAAVFRLFRDAGYAAFAVDDPDRPLTVGDGGPSRAPASGSNYIFQSVVTT